MKNIVEYVENILDDKKLIVTSEKNIININVFHSVSCDNIHIIRALENTLRNRINKKLNFYLNEDLYKIQILYEPKKIEKFKETTRFEKIINKFGGYLFKWK